MNLFANLPAFIRDGRTILFLVVCLLFFLLFWEKFGLLAYSEYNRAAIISGEYWRVISGHFTHETGMHLLLNGIAWLMVWVYGFSVCSTLTWAALLLFCSIGTSIGLLVFSPEWAIVTGFSGILHGLLGAIAILRLLPDKSNHYHTDFTGWVVLVFIAVKLIYEAVYGPTPATQSLIGLPVIVESHLYGTVSGIIAVLPIVYCNRVKTASLEPEG